MKKNISIILLLFFISLISFGITNSEKTVIISVNGNKIALSLPKDSESKSNSIIASKILSVIIQTELEKRKINLTKQNIEDDLQHYLETFDIDNDVAGKISYSANNLVSSLKKVHEKNEDVRKVYNANLKGQMSFKEWEHWVGKYNTKEKIAELVKYIPKSMDDIKAASKSYFFRDLSLWLLTNSLKTELMPKEKDIQRYYKEHFSKEKASLASERQQISNILLNQNLQNWWEQTVSKYQIIIPSLYQKSVIIIIKKLPKTSLPQQFINEYLEKKYTISTSN